MRFQVQVPKPTLIVLPKHLIGQWQKAIEKVAPEKFIIFVYYGDYRARPKGSERIVGSLLKKDYPFFAQNNEDFARTLVLTSYTTFAERHGPKKQQRWRTNVLKWSEDTAKLDLKILDPTWPQNLTGLFAKVVLDEAHNTKNTLTDVATTISWLKADFHLLMTATPIPNGVMDFAGYMPLIEPLNSDDLSSDKSLKKFGVDRRIHPYTLHRDHPASVLRLTKEAAREFIFRPAVDKIEQGELLAIVWQEWQD